MMPSYFVESVMEHVKQVFERCSSLLGAILKVNFIKIAGPES